MRSILLLALFSFFVSCDFQETDRNGNIGDNVLTGDSVILSEKSMDSMLDEKDENADVMAIDTIKSRPLSAEETVNVGSVSPKELMNFAETLVGTPYVYGSSDPSVGFDCSGFITYVFNHFKINVPRSSSQFGKVGQTVPLESSTRGDIILFTDPDYTRENSTEAGHMGLILSNYDGVIRFLHSTSGKAMSVAVTPLNEHYKKRFIRVARIFPQNNH